MSARDDETARLLERARDGDRAALDALFARNRDRLQRLVQVRLDPRLRDRIDASDVIQDACVEAVERIGDYLRDPDMPFFSWLRFLTGQKVIQLHRRHLGARRRDVRAELRLDRAALRPGSLPGATSARLAELLGEQTAPSQAAIRAEVHRALEEALDRMDPLDREVLTLRHFEQLTNPETAAELGLAESAASKRHLRALRKLKRILADLPNARE